MPTTTIRTSDGDTDVEVTQSDEGVTAWDGHPVRTTTALHTLRDAAMATARALGYSTADLHDAIGEQIVVDAELSRR